MGKIVFLHADLGIGGSERAVIDAALALKSRGHQVQFVTAHHEESHCFQETRDGTIKVTAVGDWLPRRIFGKCHALCAYIRMIYAAIYLAFFSGIKYDVIFCDQISACIPFLKFSPIKIIFYCHFPDMLLTQRQSLLKRIYRAPLDYIEEKTTGMANCILVNSNFTGKVFHDTFTSLKHIQLQVLYPIPDFSTFENPDDSPSEDLIPKDVKTIFLSINRIERRKNLSLAIMSFSKLLEDHPTVSAHLIMAGGYDERVREYVEHYRELVDLTKKLGLESKVTFIRSFNSSQKLTLLKYSSCLLYTPENEHFGIVPIESMYMKCPVIAMRSGGPLETVAHESTGFLCDNNPENVADAMYKFIDNPDLSRSFGEAGKKRVETMFSFVTFTKKLDAIVEGLK